MVNESIACEKAEEEKRLEELRKRREEKDRQMAAQRERDEEMERKRVCKSSVSVPAFVWLISW